MHSPSLRTLMRRSKHRDRFCLIRYGLLTSPFGRRYISDEIESETLSDGAAIQHTVEKGISMIRQGPVRRRLQRGSQARICRPTRWALGGPKLDMTATT